MIVLNTVDKVIVGSGMGKKDLKKDIKKSEMTMGCGVHAATKQMSKISLTEKRKPIKFL